MTDSDLIILLRAVRDGKVSVEEATDIVLDLTDVSVDELLRRRFHDHPAP